MTVFDGFKNKNIDELAEWFDNHVWCDNSPWSDWFDKKYCQNCPSVQTFVPLFNTEGKCSYCEINHKCKFFPDLDGVPEDKYVIKLWLESEENA